MNELKLTKKIFIEGKIECKTGLHIGGSDQAISIGGVDNIVIRDPLTNVPCIPGSSLKGKMRSLKEKEAGIIVKKENEKEKIEYKEKDKEKRIFEIFGSPAEEEKGPGRLIVRDAFMSAESIKQLSRLETELPYTEVKTEVAIDRITSKANPRPMERVPAGANFDFELILDIFENDDEKKLLTEVLSALELLQDDFLGGSGSRGYGKVKFKIEGIFFKDIESYINFGEKKSFNNDFKIPESLK